MDSIAQFQEVVRAASYKDKGRARAPLCNVTFFLGAGFSKSWDERFPVGNELFELTGDEWGKEGEALAGFLELYNYDTFGRTIGSGMFKDIVYQLGMLRKYPSIRPRYLDEQNIAIIEAELRSLVAEKFRKTAPLYYFDSTAEKLNLGVEITEEQNSILRLFGALSKEGDGSQGVSEGMRLHFVTTNYDFTLDGILDACCGPDDSFHLYTYRGVTSKRFCGLRNPVLVHDHWLVGNLLKVNGGFEILKSGDGYELDYRERTAAEVRANPPQIMLPSREQDYTQEYFQALFPKVVRLLQETQVLVVVGYSLPEEDALIRLLLRQFAEDRADGDNKVLFYIDLAEESVQLARMENIFPHSAEHRGLTVIPYSGPFSKWAKKVTQGI